MRWFEKLDIILFTYNLPLTAIFAFYIILNIVILPVIGVDVGRVYPLWMIVPTVVFFSSPMLYDVFTWLFRINLFRFLFYLLCVVVLYGSMLFTSLVSALLGMFGKKAKFIVTPKDSQKMGFLRALRIPVERTFVLHRSRSRFAGIRADVFAGRSDRCYGLPLVRIRAGKIGTRALSRVSATEVRPRCQTILLKIGLPAFFLFAVDYRSGTCASFCRLV